MCLSAVIEDGNRPSPPKKLCPCLMTERCCFWNSIRKGSFASGIFTLAFYTIVFTTCAFHVNNLSDEKWIFYFSLVMLVLSGLCVITSILLIVALCGDNKTMMIPWILVLIMTTIVDVIFCLALFAASGLSTGMIVMVITDFIIVGINISSIICVVSQFHQYSSGRGNAGQQRRQTSSSSYANNDNLIELTTGYILNSVTDVPDCEGERSYVNGKSASPYRTSPTRSSSINSSSFVPKEDDEDNIRS